MMQVIHSTLAKGGQIQFYNRTEEYVPLNLQAQTSYSGPSRGSAAQLGAQTWLARRQPRRTEVLLNSSTYGPPFSQRVLH